MYLAETIEHAGGDPDVFAQALGTAVRAGKAMRQNAAGEKATKLPLDMHAHRCAVRNTLAYHRPPGRQTLLAGIPGWVIIESDRGPQPATSSILLNSRYLQNELLPLLG